MRSFRFLFAPSPAPLAAPRAAPLTAPRPPRLVALAAAVLAASALAACATPPVASTLDPAAALGPPGPQREAAIARLRGLGSEGLQELLDAIPPAPPGAEPDAAVREAVDRVAGQKDAWSSRLFWHQDLEAAKAEAARTGRPILSLRLLGRLDEDLSCANSRFFRTVIYANAEVSAALREGFVLHWESVRPVPKLTIDFGDGRTIVTTITGNSIHYVLMPDGRPVDALPGLWGSQAFLAELRRDEALVKELVPLPSAELQARLAGHHAERLAEIGRELRSDAERLEEPERTQLLEILARRGTDRGGVADDIVFRTGSFTSFPSGTKLAVEMPAVRALVPDAEGIQGEIGKEAWSALARLHADESRLDEASRELARRKELRSAALEAGADAGASAGGTKDMQPLFESLQRSVAEDTVRNRYMTGARLRQWFASGTAPADVDELNERVYRELFMSPVNDSWLGLVPPDRYLGIDGGGRTGSAS